MIQIVELEEIFLISEVNADNIRFCKGITITCQR